MKSTEIVQAADGGRFNVHVSEPAQPNGHAVVVLQEAFGVNQTVRDVADRFAAEGYLAMAPDLFWRFQPGIELSRTPEDMQRALELLGRFDAQKGVSDIASTLEHIRRRPGFHGCVFTLGMCLGGRLAYLSAVRLDPDAAVGFYGVGIEKQLSEAASLRCPLLLHFGESDKFVPPEAVRQIADALASDDRVTIHTYPGAEHAFYTRGDPETVRLAHRRTLDFLEAVAAGR